MENEDSIPGVTFRVVRSNKMPPADPTKQKSVGSVELSAEINDFETWESAVGQLNGMRVYADTVDDLADEMVSVAQKRAREQVEKAQVESAKLRADLERTRQELSFVQAQYQGCLREIVQANKELTYLRKLQQEFNKLEEELSGLAFERDLGD